MNDEENRKFSPSGILGSVRIYNQANETDIT